MKDALITIMIILTGLLFVVYVRLLPTKIGNRLWAPQFLWRKIATHGRSKQKINLFSIIAWLTVTTPAFILFFPIVSDYCELLFILLTTVGVTILAYLTNFEGIGLAGILMGLLFLFNLLTYDEGSRLAPRYYNRFEGDFYDATKNIRVLVGKHLDKITIISLDDASFTHTSSQYYYLNNNKTKLINKDAASAVGRTISEFNISSNGTLRAIIKSQTGVLLPVILTKYIPSDKYAFFDAIEKANSKLEYQCDLSTSRSQNGTYIVHCNSRIKTDDSFFGKRELQPGRKSRKILQCLLDEIGDQKQLESILFVEIFTDSNGKSVTWEGKWDKESGLVVVSDTASGYRVEIHNVPR